MIQPGQTLENPVTGERFRFLQTAASSGGELLAFELGLRPGGAVPVPHVHPIQTERSEVVSGLMRFRLGFRSILAEPGEVIEVAPGVRHSFANGGEGEARVAVEVRPALAMEEMLAEVVAMAEAGRLDKRGMPRNPLDLAALARRYDEVAHAPFLGVAGQRLLLAPLVFAANHLRRPFASPSGRRSDRHLNHGPTVRPSRGAQRCPIPSLPSSSSPRSAARSPPASSIPSRRS